MSTLRLGVFQLGPWNWAYRFRLPKGHENAGTYVYGCGFPAREIAQKRSQEARKDYLFGGRA